MMGPKTLTAMAAGLLTAIGVVFVFGCFTPGLPQAGIDPSWIAVLGEAADRPARWGVDLAFTYGPASPLVTGYSNAALFTRTLPLQVGFAALFGWCAALLVARGSRARAFAGTAACVLALAAARGMPDVLFLVLPVLMVLLASRPGRDRVAERTVLAGAAALGLTAMVKMSFPLAALPLLAMVDGLQVARRRFPLHLLLFAAGIAAGARLYGQQLGDLPAYAALQGEVVAGYAAAMALEGPTWDLSPFVALAIALVGRGALARGRALPLALVDGLALALALLVLFKAGFIRHDLHALTAWTGLALLGTVAAWSRLPRRDAVVVTLAACFIVLVYAPVLTVRQTVRHGRGPALARLYHEWFVAGPRRQAAAAAEMLADPAGTPARLAAAKAAAWAQIAEAAPLGPLEGTVDILPSAQTRVMAAGLAYRGRPSFQEYGTYTAGLAAANRVFLAGLAAPRWMLFGPETARGEMAIDSRVPGLAEGPLWPDLLRLYRPDHREGALVALERRATPAPLPFGPARDGTAGFGAPVPVGGDGPTWATLDIRLDLAGRLLSALFRPPLPGLVVRLSDGTTRRFHLVPAMAAAGFLLTPLVDNASDYEVLSADRRAGPGRRVESFAVEASWAARRFYGDAIGFRLQSLDVSGLGSGAPPAATLAAALARAGTPSRSAISDTLSLPIWGLPSAPDGRRRLALRYRPDKGNARVCAAIRPADGTIAPLAERCFAGGAGAAPPFVLDIPDSVTELALETTCAAPPCGGAWQAEDGTETAVR